MLVLHDRQVGSVVSVMVEGNVASGQSVSVYLNGAVPATPVSVTASSFGSTGPSRLSFTPTTTGLYTLVLQDGSIAAHVDVVAKNVYSYLSNIEDESLGSWVWSRVDGTLQMLRQDGSVLANFAVVDSQTESSRERIQ